MTARVYVPHQVALPSGRVVRAGHYDAAICGDGRALIRVRRFGLDDSLARFNADLRERWMLPLFGDSAGVYLHAFEFEMAAGAIESPVDQLL